MEVIVGIFLNWIILVTNSIIIFLNFLVESLSDIFGLPSGPSRQKTINVIKEMNILLLGETGVGKSTFINSFANYTNFTHLNDALIDPICLVSSSFKLKGKLIEFGKHINEFHKIGSSATQKSKEYKFNINNVIVRLIDTPGLGDTRGAQQDQLNIENILTTVGSYDHLHAICILLKPDIARSTSLFQFVITQLLAQLDKNAAKNIIFIYTNSRAASYSPGDAEATVRTILDNLRDDVRIDLNHNEKKNVFCFDNEPFRYMLGLKNGLSFSKLEKSGYKESWEVSRESYQSLVSYVMKLKPHNVEKTMVVFKSRSILFKLIKPIDDYGKTIEKNKNTRQNLKETLSDAYEEIKILEKKLEIKEIYIKYEDLVKRDIVCNTHGEYLTYRNGKTVFIPLVCASNEDIANNLWPVFMNAIDSFFSWAILCPKCRCMASNHTYKMNRISKCFKSNQDILDKFEAKRKEIRENEDRSRELKMENRRCKHEYNNLSEKSIKLAQILKQNSIIPFNESVINYYNLQIENLQLTNFQNKNELIKHQKELIEKYNLEKKLWTSMCLKVDLINCIKLSEAQHLIKELIGRC